MNPSAQPFEWLKRLLYFSFACFALVPIAADSTVVTSAETDNRRIGAQIIGQIPRTIYVGDEVTLSIRLEAVEPGLSSGPLPTASIMYGGNPDNVEVEGAQFSSSPEGLVMTLKVRFWQTGEMALPLAIKDKGTLEPLSVFVSSVLEGIPRETAPLRPVLSPPGTGLILYGIFTLSLFMALAFIFIKTRIVPAFYLARIRYPRRRALSRLKKILAHFDSFESKEAFAILEDLAREVRLFLGAVSGEDLQACTGKDFLKLEKAKPAILYKTATEAVCAFFALRDRLLFSGKSCMPYTAEFKRHALGIKDLCEEIDRKLIVQEHQDLRKRHLRKRVIPKTIQPA
jgi:hypothetical protein